jgi:hypothetical protein
MKYSAILVGGLASIVGAHSAADGVDAVIPQLLGGRRFLSELTARNALPQAASVVFPEKRTVEERQDSNGRCGPGFGKCTTGCCSDSGYFLFL